MQTKKIVIHQLTLWLFFYACPSIHLFFMLLISSVDLYIYTLIKSDTTWLKMPNKLVKSFNLTSYQHCPFTFMHLRMCYRSVSKTHAKWYWLNAIRIIGVALVRDRKVCRCAVSRKVNECKMFCSILFGCLWYKIQDFKAAEVGSELTFISSYATRNLGKLFFHLLYTEHTLMFRYWCELATARPRA